MLDFCRAPAGLNGRFSRLFKVEVPIGLQELQLSVLPPNGSLLQASHSNWSPNSGSPQHEITVKLFVT